MDDLAERLGNLGGPEIIRLDDLSQLSDIRDEWLRLMAGIPETSYFQTPDWVLSWWETIGRMPPTELEIGRAHV